MISRWDVLDIHARATAATATATASSFLAHPSAHISFPIGAVQVDGGADLHGAFEQQCRLRQIKLFVLPPRSPKLNGSVESAQRTHTEEFYQVYKLPWRMREIRPHLQRWQKPYNYTRPHQSHGHPSPPSSSPMPAYSLDSLLCLIGPERIHSLDTLIYTSCTIPPDGPRVPPPSTAPNQESVITPYNLFERPLHRGTNTYANNHTRPRLRPTSAHRTSCYGRSNSRPI